MNGISLKIIIDKAKRTQSVVIVGASKTGRNLFELLRQNNIRVICFFDNDMDLQGKRIYEVDIVSPKKMCNDNTLYVIASINYHDELKEQLLELGIKDRDIVKYYPNRCYEYYKDMDPKYYKDDLNDWYYGLFAKYINWNKPVTYNEIINWEKLFDRDERKTRLSDKYLVRDWIKEKIGDKYLNKLYGVWDTAEDINFSDLPNKYVLKMTHGAGYNIIVEDNSCIDKEAICSQLTKWAKINFAYFFLELHYKDIVPRIICEEYLESSTGNLDDYKVFCFHGKAKYIMYLTERNSGNLKMAFYDTDWNKQSFYYSFSLYEGNVPKPSNLQEMLELSEVLSRDFRHVRVDWYTLPDNRLIFGEMTFSSYAGMAQWKPEEYDYILGQLINTF